MGINDDSHHGWIAAVADLRRTVEAELLALDLTTATVGEQWVAAVEQTSRELIDGLGAVLNRSDRPVVVVLVVDALPSVVHVAARHAARGIVGVAALEQARVGRRINAVAVTASSAAEDLRAVVKFLADEDAAAYCTGATIDLTHAAAASAPSTEHAVEAPVLVTGASGGLGRAAAAALIAAGHRVILSDLDGPALREAGYLLGAEAIPCNVTDPDDVARLAADPRVATGLSGLAVYHGVGGAGAVGEMSDGVRDRSLVINGTGVFNVVGGLTLALLKDTPGSVVVLASQAGLIAELGGGAYCASKFAAVGYVEALAAELAPHGVRVHAICPGPVDTPLLRKHFEGMSAAEGMTFDAYWQSRLGEIPLRRFGQASQIAHAAPLLIGLRATGVVLSATGGVVLT